MHKHTKIHMQRVMSAGFYFRPFFFSLSLRFFFLFLLVGNDQRFSHSVCERVFFRCLTVDGTMGHCQQNVILWTEFSIWPFDVKCFHFFSLSTFKKKESDSEYVPHFIRLIKTLGGPASNVCLAHHMRFYVFMCFNVKNKINAWNYPAGQIHARTHRYTKSWNECERVSEKHSHTCTTYTHTYPSIARINRILQKG